ncbi:MAG TPA: DMT family transporter [Candidatus Baltobacteraceae bacterium]|nr:DMT family transporter [Candidatus Baltobacteraceae bacterium]
MTPTESIESSGALMTPEAGAPRRPSALLLVASFAFILLAWAVNYPAGKIALQHMDPVTLASLRIELAAILMLAIHFSRPRRVRFDKRDFWTFALLAFLGVVLNQGFYTAGLKYTTSERSVLVIALGPIMILLFARALKLEAFTTAKIAGMAFAFIGVLLLETERKVVGQTSAMVGDAITLISVVGFAIYSVLGKRLLDVSRRAKYDAISFNTFITVAAAVMLLPVAARQGIVLDWRAVGWAGWGGMIYMAVGSSVLAYTLFYWLLKYVDASRVATINYMQPFVVILLSVAFLGERPTARLILGGALVLIGVYFVERVSLGGAKLKKIEGPEA